MDAANVVGSVPNGWWRDRKGAAERLRDVLRTTSGYGEIVLVVEGRARGVQPVEGVTVVEARRSGDDTIVEIVRDAAEDVVVVTADRGLRERVEALGATVIGPRSLAYP